MSKRGLGVLLVLAFAVAIASIVQDFRFDLTAAQQQSAASTIERTVGSIDLAIANLRAAQAGYVAAGQGPDFWMKRGSELASEIEIRISSLQAPSTSDEARAHYDAALAALTALATIDKKARTAIANGERLQASDLIFMDSSESTQRLTAELQAAGDVELAASAAQLASTRRLRLAATGAGLLVILGLAAFLAQRGRAAAPVASPEPVVDLSAWKPAEALKFDDAWPAQAVNLKDAAEVCVDLARVLDGRDVQPLLERAAAVLDAKGLVLWVVDQSGLVLLPSLASGYPDRVLRKLGSLDTAADNPTSLAFRSMQAQMIHSPTVGSTGAIAVPLITASGCIGVLAAEVKKSTPSDDTLSVARMFAAQLATFVVPTSSATSQVAQA